MKSEIICSCIGTSIACFRGHARTSIRSETTSGLIAMIGTNLNLIHKDHF
jgi:hypothetical protein